MEPGHLLAEVILGDVVRQVIDGQLDLLLGGWEWEDPAAAATTLRNLGRAWRVEDELETPPPSTIVLKCSMCGGVTRADGHADYPAGTVTVVFPCASKTCAPHRQDAEPQCLDTNGRTIAAT